MNDTDPSRITNQLTLCNQLVIENVYMYIQFPKRNMDRWPFYGAKVLFSGGRGRM